MVLPSTKRSQHDYPSKAKASNTLSRRNAAGPISCFARGPKQIKQEPKHQSRIVALKPERVTTLPAVFSKVKELKVAGVTLLNQGTPQAAVAIDVINNSDDAVISLEFTTGDANDWSGLGIDGFEDPDNPQVAIPAHSLKTFTWFLGEVLEGYPIVISGASFANGTDDGDARSLDIMHKDRERNRAKKAKKAGNQ